MAVYVIQLENLNEQVQKLSEILRKYEKQWKENGEELYTHNLDDEIESLNSFKNDFEDVIEGAAATEEETIEDIYQNEYKRGYRYAEVTITKEGTFDKIRLLGTDGVIKKRFYISDVEHIFSPTTISLVTNIREIIRKPFDVNDFLDLCGKSFKESNGTAIQEKTKKETRYTWEEVAANFFVPPAQTEEAEEITDEQREKLRKKYKKPFLTKEQLASRNAKIQANKKALYEKSLKEQDKQKSLAETIKKELEKEKQDQDYQRILNNIGKFVDRYSFACLLQEAIECVVPRNISCESLFKDLSVSEIFDRLAAIFPRGSDTFKELEKLVEENIFGNISERKQEIDRLKKMISSQEKELTCLKCEDISQEALNLYQKVIDENKQKLSSLEEELKKEQKRIYEDLQLSERQQRLARQNGNLVAIISSAETDEEKAGVATNADRVLKLIDTIIPLEDLCGLLLQSLTLNFDLSAFRFPELRPVNDIFAGFSVEIQTAFLQVIVQAIILLIETILDDLFNCDNLDNLVAAAVAGANESFAALSDLDLETGVQNISAKVGENSEKLGIYGDLANLFGGSQLNIATSFDKNYDKFVDRIAPALTKAVKFKVDNLSYGSKLEIATGVSKKITKSVLKMEEQAPETVKETLTNTVNSISSNRKGILDFFLSQGGSQSISNWDIDPTGEKFVVSDGITVFDIDEIDKNINSSVSSFLNSIPPDLVTEDILLALAKEESEKVAIEKSARSASALKVEEETIKQEMSALVSNFVAIASPTEVIKLMSGNATNQTLQLVSEIMILKAPTLKNVFGSNPEIKNLFLQFGKATGLNQLLPKMNLLSSIPESNLRLVPPKLCAPFDNVDNFRKALMTRAVPLDVAERIFNSINNEKIKKYNDLVDNLLTISTGNIPAVISSDPKAKFLDEIRNNVLNPALRDSESILDQETLDEEQKQEKQSASDLIRQKMNDLTNSSPIYQSMLESTLFSIFSPIRDTFDSDMQGFIDSYSKNKEIVKEIPRTIELQTEKGTAKTINPEFKDFINAGLVPIVVTGSSGAELDHVVMVDKTGLVVGDEGQLDDLRVSGNPNTDFTTPSWSLKRLVTDIFSLGFENPDRVKKPIHKKINKKIVGEGFKEDMETGLSEKLAVLIDKDEFLVSIRDFRSTNSVLPELQKDAEIANTFDSLPLLKEQIENGIPRWNINFVESKKNAKEISAFSIETEGLSVTAVKGFEDFYKSTKEISKQFRITSSMRRDISEYYNSVDYPIKTRAEVFQEFFSKQMREHVQDFEQNETEFKNSLMDKQKLMIEKVVSSISNSIINTRLFQETNVGGQTSDDKLVFLQLFDFVRKPTEKEQKCNFDPHIMGFDGLYEKFKEIYDNEPEVQQEFNSNGLANKRTRYGNASYKIMIEVLLKLMVVDFALKTLPVLDSFLYAKDFSNIEFLNDFLVNHAINDLKNMDIYDSFKREMKNQISQTRKKRVQDLSQDSDLEDCRDIESLRLSSAECEDCGDLRQVEQTEQALITTGEGAQQQRKRNVSDEEFKQELKERLKEQLESVLSKLGEIFFVSDNERKQEQFKKFFVNGLNLYDVHENNEKIFNKKIRDVKTVSELRLDPSLRQSLSEIAGSNVEKLFKVGKLFGNKTAAEFAGSSWVYKQYTEYGIEDSIDVGDLFLERYIKIGRLNSSFRTEYAQLKDKIENKVVKLSTFVEAISAIDDNTTLIDCDDPSKSLFVEQPKFGLRLNYVYDKTERKKIDTTLLNTFNVNGKRLKIKTSAKDEKLLSIGEEQRSDEESLKFFKVYNVLKITQAEQVVNTTFTAKHLKALASSQNYNRLFLPILKERLLSTKSMQVMFDYCVPIKEISTIALFHSYLSNNGEKQKYLFEPTKNMIKQTFDLLDNFGDKTKTAQKIATLKKTQQEQAGNEGNPAGPLNFDALKIFLRTPIHILRGLATIVDPNIFIADKIVAGAAVAGSLLNQKIYVPYSVTSIALLPAPLFLPPPVGIVPPLTAYNIMIPLGPLFLALEPLLWDLPWFKSINADPRNPSRDLSDYGINDNNYLTNCVDSQEKEMQSDTEQEQSFEIEQDIFQYMLEEIKKVCNS